ncbi:hypothetical protein CLV89_11474 [Tritonibacter scottomollicae]|uniref:Uncharacterized protein n=1 Tax=Tritonibacter scottomollicae TaxID=483013 RepID=A0A2T1AAJ0_TRISK|nr:hypothetical protein CLV89_11474 [Tritonibacter scottomollicae]
MLHRLRQPKVPSHIKFARVVRSIWAEAMIFGLALSVRPVLSALQPKLKCQNRSHNQKETAKTQPSGPRGGLESGPHNGLRHTGFGPAALNGVLYRLNKPAPDGRLSKSKGNSTQQNKTNF